MVDFNKLLRQSKEKREAMAIKRNAPVQDAEAVNFGDLEFYVSGGGGLNLPPGLYAMEHEVLMFLPRKKDNTPSGTPAFLAAKLIAHPINEDGTPVEEGEVHETILSMGSKAHESFQPGADGKSLRRVPNPKFPNALADTNWQLYLKSLYDCGLPRGIFSNDFTVLDGIWVRTDLQAAPAKRKEYQGRGTGAAAAQNQQGQEKKQYDDKVVVVVDILDGGKPWEGGGGIPEADAKPTAKKSAGPAGKSKATAAAPAGKKTGKPAVAAEEEGDDEAVKTAAMDAIGTVLSKKANKGGMKKAKLRMEVFGAIGEEDEDMAQAVADTIFADEDQLSGVLEELGFELRGPEVVPA